MTALDRIRAGVATYTGRGLPANVKALGVTSFFQDVASDMVYPLLPAFLHSLGGGPALFGAMESAADAVLAFVKGTVGRESDRRRSRRPWVLAGYGLSALLRPLLALAHASGVVVALRVADRFAKALRTAPRDAMLAESVEPARRAYAFSFHRGLDHLGAAVGPVIAALVLWQYPGHLRTVFALATFPAIVGWLVALGFAREQPRADVVEAQQVVEQVPPDEPRRAPLLARLAPIGRVPARLRPPLAAFGLFSLGNASDGFLLFLLASAGFSLAQVTLLWSGFHVVKYLSSTPGGMVADRFGRRRTIIVGWVVYAASYAAFAAWHDTRAVAFVLVPYALFYGLTEGAERALMLDIVDQHVPGDERDETGAGSVLGAFHMVTGLGVLLSSAVFGAIYQLVSVQAAFTAGAALAGAAAVLLLATSSRKTTAGAA